MDFEAFTVRMTVALNAVFPQITSKTRQKTSAQTDLQSSPGKQFDKDKCVTAAEGNDSDNIAYLFIYFLNRDLTDN